MNLYLRYFIFILALSQAAFETWGDENNLSVNKKQQTNASQAIASGVKKSEMTELNGTLPRPPQQESKWTPPACELPTNYITATALLFKQGLADPRGCDYREIEVRTGSIMNREQKIIKTRGWVLPGQKKNQFGICWNGLVYPLVSVGTNASLETDVLSMMTNSSNFRQLALPESSSVAINTITGIRGCLLLRLGQVDLATRYWAAEARHPSDWTMRNMFIMAQPVTINGLKLPSGDSYYYWANNWTWSLFDRMICAHIRGDEKLALADARLLSKIRSQVEETCNQRGFKPSQDSQLIKQAPSKPYLSFLEKLPEILTDLERRDKEGTRVSIISRGITNITDQTARIQALIKDLDLVTAFQFSQPGTVNLFEDPIVSALIQEKDASVEPLLSCLEQDKRLTRSVSYNRDFFQGRNVIPVKNAAFIILESILKASFNNDSEIRAYWNKYKHLKIEERWYAILSDDSAQNRWHEAAACIVQHENVVRFPMGFQMEKHVATNSTVKLLGECLRNKRNPTVTELLTRRALEIPTNDIASYNLAACCKMAEYLEIWDLKATLPVTRTLSKRVSITMKYSEQNLGSHLTKLALARAKAGDSAAFEEYTSWLETTSPSQFKGIELDWFNPLKQYLTNSTLQNTADKLFGTTNSPWGNLPWKSAYHPISVDFGLMPIKSYRSLLCRELLKTNLCGTVTLRMPSTFEYTITNLNQNGFIAYSLPKGSSVTNSTIANIRWGDWIAISLASSKSNHPFDPFASIEKRDQKIHDMIQELTKNEF